MADLTSLPPIPAKIDSRIWRYNPPEHQHSLSIYYSIQFSDN
jgi:hypothetical protein